MPSETTPSETTPRNITRRNTTRLRSLLALGAAAAVTATLAVAPAASAPQPGIAHGLTAPAAATAQQAASSVTLVPLAATWKHRYAHTWAANWQARAFDDSRWASGQAPLGWGTDTRTTVSARGLNPLSAQFRHRFTVDDPAAVETVELRVRADDGVLVYINGRELARVNLRPGPVGPGTYATIAPNGPRATRLHTISVPASLLVTGENVIAASTHLNWRRSPSVSFAAELIASARVAPSGPVQSAPAPSPSAPAPSPSAPAPSPSAPAPAPSPSVPAPSPSAPVPSPSAPVPSPSASASAPSPNASAPQTSAPAPRPSAPAPRPSAPAPQPGDRAAAPGAAEKPAAQECGPQHSMAPACGVLWGVYTTRGSTLTTAVTDLERKVGRPFDMVLRYHDFSTHIHQGLFPDESQRALGESRILVLAWQARVTSNDTDLRWNTIARGDWDRTIDAAADRVKAYGTDVMISFDPEFDRLGHKGTMADYVAAYQRIHDRFAAKGVTNVVWAWVPTGYLGAGRDKITMAGYPGDSYVDWVGFDPYNFYTCNNTAWDSFEEEIAPEYNFFVEQGLGHKPFLLMEYGTAFDPQNPERAQQWLRDIPSTVKRYPNLKAVIRYDSNSTTSATCNLSIENGSGMLQAFRDAGLDPYVYTRR